jgi:serine/threonine-protein kinase
VTTIRDVTLPPVRTTPVSTGRVLAGRYTVGEVIGRGGMADVHMGRDTRTGRSVAIKTLRSTSAQDPLLRSSLRREAQLLGRVRHHAIVALLDAGHGSDGDGNASPGTHGGPYIVMEHVDGRSLRDLLSAGELTRETSVRYQLGLLAALEASHRAGIVHRDIKPANVMVTASGAVKLVDFGIARASADPTVTVTHIQEFLGTPAYFSTEQARGESTDARSDLYSAGCLLFEMLTGRAPFAGDDPVLVAYQHVHQPAPQAGTGVPALDAVIAKALAKDREERFQSAQTFREALRSAESTSPPTRLTTTTGATPWDASPSGTRTAPRSGCTTRTRAPDSPSCSSTGTRWTVTAGRSRPVYSSTPAIASSPTTAAASASPPRSAPATTTTPSPPTWTAC